MFSPHALQRPAFVEPNKRAGYGAAGGAVELLTTHHNKAAIFCVLGPWALFTFTAWAFSFYLRYTQPGMVAFVAACGAAVVAPFGGHAALSAKSRGAFVGHRLATWPLVTFWSLLIAWLLGMAVGESIFQSCMRPYYDTSSLNMYAGVDLSKTNGAQLQDAGIVMFAAGTRLDRSRSAFFRESSSGDVFCAAPIVPMPANGTTPLQLASFDFWAVGVNCCAEADESFDCGEYNNPYARAGLRVLPADGHESLYKTAIQSAEAKYGIRAGSPLLFRWRQDPSAETAGNLDRGFNRFLLSSLLCLAAQLFVATLAAASLLSKGVMSMGDRVEA